MLGLKYPAFYAFILHMEMSCNYKRYINLFITLHLVFFYHEVNFNCGIYVFRLKAQSELKWD